MTDVCQHHFFEPAGERLVASYETLVQRSAEANRALLNEPLRSVQTAA
jgi:hypothetical protein